MGLAKLDEFEVHALVMGSSSWILLSFKMVGSCSFSFCNSSYSMEGEFAF
jgi:hypothetical protein